MGKFKKVLGVMGLALCFSLASKVDSQAAGKLTGIKQVDASTYSVKVSVDADLGTEYYTLELRNASDNNWVVLDKSSSADNLYSSSLSAGKSYYARVRGYADYDCTQPTTEYSDELEVVTVPDTTNMKAVQSGATTNGFSVKYSGVSGANTYFMTYNDEIIGKSSNSTVKTSKKLSAAKGYWVNAYAARKSKSGYMAYSKYGYDYCNLKTLTNAVGSKSFGVSSAYQNIDVYYFSVNVSGDCDGTHLQFATPSGKVKKNLYDTTSYRVADFINGNFYKYRVRTYVNCGSKKVFSKWSGYHYIGVAKNVKGESKKSSYKSKYKTIYLDWSKINYACGYDVYISNRENAGYKKVKSVSAKNRKLTITKYGKSKLKASSTYYIKIVPKAKVGKKTVSSSIYHVLKVNAPQ